jgi:hypothetical protein
MKSNQRAGEHIDGSTDEPDDFPADNHAHQDMEELVRCYNEQLRTESRLVSDSTSNHEIVLTLKPLIRSRRKGRCHNALMAKK